MAETDLHRDEMVRLIQNLQVAFADHLDVYVSGNLLLYYEEGNPRRSVAPDVFVVFGVAKHRRTIYRLWEEGRPPNLVIEVTSRSTRSEDRRTKRELYARLGVREYVLYDPLAEYLRPPLQGYRLRGSEYVPLEATRDGALLSDELGMELMLEAGRLRLIDRQTGMRLRSPSEQAAIAGARADAAEARIAELEEQLRRLRGN